MNQSAFEAPLISGSDAQKIISIGHFVAEIFYVEDGHHFCLFVQFRGIFKFENSNTKIFGAYF